MKLVLLIVKLVMDQIMTCQHCVSSYSMNFPPRGLVEWNIFHIDPLIAKRSEMVTLELKSMDNNCFSLLVLSCYQLFSQRFKNLRVVSINSCRTCFICSNACKVLHLKTGQHMFFDTFSLGLES